MKNLEITTQAVLGGKPHHYIEQTDPNGNVSVRYSDARGNIMRVERYNENKAKLLTSARYEYNLMGEIEKALDAACNPLAVKYDMLGRRTAIQSNDIGRYEYTYNTKGQLEQDQH